MQRNFVAVFYRENASFLVKQRISVSEPPLGGAGLMGNICDSSSAGLKACGNGKGEINKCMVSRWYIYTVMDNAHIELKQSRLDCGVIDV